MASSIPVLWPENINVEVVRPIAILKAQIEPLRRMSGGLLDVFIETVRGERFVSHSLDLVARALNNHRQRLLSVTHQIDSPYPVKVESHYSISNWEAPPDPWSMTVPTSSAEGVGKSPVKMSPAPGTLWKPNALTEDEFMTSVKNILRSSSVRSLIESTLALSNVEAEVKESQETDPTQAPR